MTIEKVLLSLEDLRAWLESAGVTTWVLAAVGFAALVLFTLSLREVLVWFLKVNTIKGEVRMLRLQISELQNSLFLLRQEIRAEEKSPETDAPAGLIPPTSEKSSRFNFDH